MLLTNQEELYIVNANGEVLDTIESDEGYLGDVIDGIHMK